MSDIVSSQPKERLERTVVAQSKWVTVYKDRVVSNGGAELEYWCVGRSDSVIILAMQNGQFLLTEAQYRPGVDTKTLDFPGGRIDETDPFVAANTTLRREFQLDDSVELEFESLTKQPLMVDSAFSSQHVYGYVVELPEDLEIPIVKRYTAEQLLDELQCMQCRTFLLEWLWLNKNK